MDKTISITLNNFAFTLNENAYVKLSEYLDGIKEHFSSTDSVETTDEIISDIESSIAEKFSAKLGPSKQVITIADIEELIKVMGSVQDIASETVGAESVSEIGTQKKKEEKKETRTAKRLYRDTDDIIIAGVASGLANYFGIDPVIVRLLFFVTIFFGGAGVIIYLVLWLVVPKAETSTQKLEAQGDPVTLKKLEKLAREKTEEIKNMDKSRLKGFFQNIINFIGKLSKALGRFFMKFGTVIGVLIGIPIIIASTLAITAIGFAAAAMVFNTNSPYLDIPIEVTEIVSESLLPIASVSVFIIAFVPLMFLLLLGASLVSRKNAFSVSSSIVLISIWMVAVIAAGVIGLDSAPRIQRQVDAFHLGDNYETISREIEAQDFDQVTIRSAYQANIIQGNEYRLVATGREEDLDDIEVRVRDGELEIKRDSDDICLFCYDQDVSLEITAPDINSLEASGASRVSAFGFEGFEIELVLSGASRGEFDLDYEMYDIDASGASNINLSSASSTNIDIELSSASKAEVFGKTLNLIADLSGASILTANDLEVIDAEVEASGASKAEINASNNLKVNTSGTSKVYYQGNPKLVSNEASSVIAQ